MVLTLKKNKVDVKIFWRQKHVWHQKLLLTSDRLASRNNRVWIQGYFFVIRIIVTTSEVNVCLQVTMLTLNICFRRQKLLCSKQVWRQNVVWRQNLFWRQQFVWRQQIVLKSAHFVVVKLSDVNLFCLTSANWFDVIMVWRRRSKFAFK